MNLIAPPSRASPKPTRMTPAIRVRSEEHTSELQSPYDLVCRLLLEKKKTKDECRGVQMKRSGCRVQVGMLPAAAGPGRAPDRVYAAIACVLRERRPWFQATVAWVRS